MRSATGLAAGRAIFGITISHCAWAPAHHHAVGRFVGFAAGRFAGFAAGLIRNG